MKTMPASVTVRAFFILPAWMKGHRSWTVSRMARKRSSRTRSSKGSNSKRRNNRSRKRSKQRRALESLPEIPQELLDWE